MRFFNRTRAGAKRAAAWRTLANVAGIVSACLVLAVAFDLPQRFAGAIVATAHSPAQTVYLASLVTLVVLLVSRTIELRVETIRRAAAEAQASEIAYRDALTGLGNRAHFESRLKEIEPGPLRAVLMLDIDDFKPLNDTMGHAAGDLAVRQTARRISDACPSDALVCRFDSDEFVVLTGPLAEAADADWLAQRILSTLDPPVVVNGVECVVRASAGVALIETGERADAETVRRADLALYASKTAERGGFCRYDRAMDESLQRRTVMERKLRKAIEAGVIRPHFQPLVDLKTSEIIGFEALARWTDPDLGDIAPSEFVALAEKTGQINSLADQLLRRACQAAATWPPHLKLAFNLSPLQLKDKLTGLRILSILGETGLSPHRLEIEVTESALIDDPATARELLDGLRHSGARIAIDDFGSGYSSLYHLREFKFDRLKIDRSFVWEMERGDQNLAIITAIMDLSRGLGLTATAEGIESETQLSSLLSCGCQQGQGLLFGQPMSAEQTADMIDDLSEQAVTAS